MLALSPGRVRPPDKVRLVDCIFASSENTSHFVNYVSAAGSSRSFVSLTKQTPSKVLPCQVDENTADYARQSRQRLWSGMSAMLHIQELALSERKFKITYKV